MAWLRYRNGAGAWTNRFYHVTMLRRLPTVERVTGVTLRGRLFDKKLHSRYAYLITISADQIWGESSVARDFLEAFFIADERGFNASADPLTTPVSWEDVQVEGGDIPVEFLEGNTLLTEYTLRLNQKEPS